MKRAYLLFLTCIAVLFVFAPDPSFALALANPPQSPLYKGGTEGGFTKGPITIEADSISYDRERDVYHAQGRVNISFTGGLIKADSVLLDRAGNNVTAEGRVTITTDSDILEGDKVDFDIASNTGVVYAGKMFIAKNHFYIKGERIEKRGEADYRIKEASVTTCDGDSPDWSLKCRQLDVTIDGYGTIRDGKFLARDIPLLYIPYLLFPAKTTRQTGFLFPRVAYSRDKLGLDVELPFYLVLSKSADATFYQRYMDKRGFKEGVEFRYVIDSDSYGVLYGDYLRDNAKITENADGTSRDWQSPQNRWSFYFHNYTAFQPDLYLRADIARVSDNWYFKDFSSHNYYLDHYSQSDAERFKKIPFVGDESLEALDSKLRLVKDWSLYNLTALIKYTDDLANSANDATVQKYPEITLSGAKQSLPGTPLNFTLSSSFSGNYRAEGQKGGLFDLSPVLSLPLNVGGNFQLTPEVEVRGTFWEREDDAASDKRGHRSAYRLGTSLTTTAFRDFSLNGKRIEKIRHEIKPELTYAYVPNFSQDDLPDFADRIDEKNAVTAALINTLTAKLKGKDGAASYLDIMRFKLAQNYNIKETRRDASPYDSKNRHFDNIDMELDLTPVRYFAFYVRNRFNVNSGAWEKANYDLNLSDERGDSAAIGYRYTRDILEEINLSLKVPLTKALDVTYDLKRNEFDHKNMSNTLGFNYRRQCWSVGFSYSDEATDKRVMLSFSLYGLGK
ncbi:MAG: LPS assembly protein LptD [Syntrophales bacterium]|nr:LPS assembly protein LptD [Syntrophales bacterium]